MHTKSIFRRLTFANVTSCLALFVALGGASYAAIKLPANSVGTKQVKNHSLLLDLLILIKTVRVVLLGEGAR